MIPHCCTLSVTENCEVRCQESSTIAQQIPHHHLEIPLNECYFMYYLLHILCIDLKKRERIFQCF